MDGVLEKNTKNDEYFFKYMYFIKCIKSLIKFLKYKSRNKFIFVYSFFYINLYQNLYFYINQNFRNLTLFLSL